MSQVLNRLNSAMNKIYLEYTALFFRNYPYFYFSELKVGKRGILLR